MVFHAGNCKINRVGGKDRKALFEDDAKEEAPLSPRPREDNEKLQLDELFASIKHDSKIQYDLRAS